MDSLHDEALLASGLTKNEGRVYLALLKLGPATAQEITRASGVHRVNVYDALERLRNKGLIATVVRSNKHIYEPADPEQLLQLVKEKEELIAQALPRLREEFKVQKGKQQVYHFFGPEGVLQAHMMLLHQGPTIYGIGGSGLNRKYLKHRHTMWSKERLRRGIRQKLLYYEFTRRRKHLLWSDPLTELRFLPSRYRTIGMVVIAGNLVVNLLPVKDHFMAIVIENPALADTYLQFFRFLWDHAKE